MLGIVDRQVGWGLRGLDAYAGYGIAAALFLALPGTLQKGEHIRVTLLLQRLPRPGQRARVVEPGRGAVLTACCRRIPAGWSGCPQTTNDISQAPTPRRWWLPQIAMALGCVGLFVALADAAWSRATAVVRASQRRRSRAME